VDQPLQLAGLGSSLAINAYRTLKLLALGVVVLGYNDPLCGLNRELRFIAGNNILEAFELYLMIDNEPEDCRTESEDWSAFDSVLTESDAFPMLHQVSVEIYWFSESVDVSEQEAVSKILEDKFPRLVESKVVKFNFWDNFGITFNMGVGESLL
jgi:hypothetical protein